MLRQESPAVRAGADGELPERIAADHAAFVVGFPCTQFGCRGLLRRDGHRSRSAITCSVCEDVYYLVGES